MTTKVLKNQHPSSRPGAGTPCMSQPRAEALRDKQAYMSESSELDSSPCPSDFQRL